jgi:sugar phosphate isomerase/epimerase
MGSICPSSASFHAERGPAETQVRDMLRVAHALGSPILRCVLGGPADRHGALPLAAHVENTVAVCRAVRGQAMDLGITLAIENHGEMQARELAALVEAAGPEYVGVCLDTGNPVMVLEDPLVTLDYLAPYVVSSHVRDAVLWAHPRGAAAQWVAAGDGTVGLAEWARAFQARCPAAAFNLEIITGRPPQVLPYLEADFWADYGAMPAWELARFERLVRAGQPFCGAMVVAAGGDLPPEYAAALVAQQRVDVERSVRYCREQLGLGERPTREAG